MLKGLILAAVLLLAVTGGRAGTLDSNAPRTNGGSMYAISFR